MTNRFISWLEKVGHDFKKGLDFTLPIAETVGEGAVAMFAPALGPLFNQTVSAVVTAEQGAAAIGKQSGSGAQKLAAVVALMGPLIKQALADAGKANDDAAVEKYISAVVTILNLLPAGSIAGASTGLPALPVAVAAAPVAGSSTAPPAPGPTSVTEISKGGSAADVIFP